MAGKPVEQNVAEEESEDDEPIQYDFLDNPMEDISLEKSESDDGVDQGRTGTVPVKEDVFYSSWLMSISAEVFRAGGGLRKYITYNE